MAHSRVRKPLWPSAALQIEPLEEQRPHQCICGSHTHVVWRFCLHCSRLLHTHRLSASESLFAVAELPEMAIGGLSIPREEQKVTGRPHKAPRRR